MYKYLCSKCAAQCENHRASDKTITDKSVRFNRVKQTTLGTWHCPAHGKVPVKRERA